MGLNKVKQGSQMYPWITHTWNPIRGRCPHDCSYCYMKGLNVGELRLDEKELSTLLGYDDKIIFVGSSTDMWAYPVPQEWIAKVVKCYRDNDAYNDYLFQTKNPSRFLDWIGWFSDDTILGTTIETNRLYIKNSKAPTTYARMEAMRQIKHPKMISIEPIMDFDFEDMVRWINNIKPQFVSIGADSKGHNLPEPPPEKLQRLIEELQNITTVKIKDNLSRILRPTFDSLNRKG